MDWTILAERYGVIILVIWAAVEIVKSIPTILNIILPEKAKERKERLEQAAKVEERTVKALETLASVSQGLAVSSATIVEGIDSIKDDTSVTRDRVIAIGARIGVNDTVPVTGANWNGRERRKAAGLR